MKINILTCLVCYNDNDMGMTVYAIRYESKLVIEYTTLVFVHTVVIAIQLYKLCKITIIYIKQL